jgi:hypothetical protein
VSEGRGCGWGGGGGGGKTISCPLVPQKNPRRDWPSYLKVINI